jgi:thiamine phosphate synthase YjbQ (UPF0047 family)
MPHIEQALAESGGTEGLCLVNAMNIAASVFINNNKSGLYRGFEYFSEKLAPEKPYDRYDHNGYEDNADAHLKRSAMGRQARLRTCEQIFYGGFDGMHDKRVLVNIIGK